MMGRKKNRKIRRQSRLLPMRFISIAVLGVTLLLVYLGMDMNCGQIREQIRTLETRYEALDGEYRREANRWTAMKAPDQIEQALLRHGLNMPLPQGEQVVRLDLSGASGSYRPRDQYAGQR